MYCASFSVTLPHLSFSAFVLNDSILAAFIWLQTRTTGQYRIATSMPNGLFCFHPLLKITLTLPPSFSFFFEAREWRKFHKRLLIFARRLNLQAHQFHGNFQSVVTNGLADEVLSRGFQFRHQTEFIPSVIPARPSRLFYKTAEKDNIRPNTFGWLR
jgi:hypothetical protein